MTFIDLSGEELFYEMGITVDSMESLKQATASDSLAPVHKFWVLDGLVFSELKDGVSEQIAQWLEAMEALLAKHTFGYKERTAYTMKRMLFYPKRETFMKCKGWQMKPAPVFQTRSMRVFLTTPMLFHSGD